MRSQGRIFCRSCGWGAGARAGGSLARRTTSSTRNQVSIATIGLCNPKKNNVYFRALPKLAPPPLPPNLGNLVLFFRTSKTTICKSVKSCKSCFIPPKAVSFLITWTRALLPEIAQKTILSGMSSHHKSSWLVGKTRKLRMHVTMWIFQISFLLFMNKIYTYKYNSSQPAECLRMTFLSGKRWTTYWG